MMNCIPLTAIIDDKDNVYEWRPESRPEQHEPDSSSYASYRCRLNLIYAYLKIRQRRVVATEYRR